MGAGGLVALQLAQHVFDQVAGMFQVDRQFDGFRPAPVVLRRQVVAVDLRQVELDRAVQRIDVVIQGADTLPGVAVVVAQHQVELLEHLLHQIADAQGLAHRVGQRQAGGGQGGRVQVARAHAVLAFRALRQQPGAQSGHGAHGGQHQHTAQAVVGHVEADYQAGAVQRQPVHPGHQRVEERDDQQQADQFVEQTAQRHPAPGGALQAAVEQRQHAAADVGTDHQADGHRQAEQPGAGQRGGEQHRSQAGIAEQGEQRADQRVEQDVAGQLGEQHLDAGGFGDRLCGGDDQLQRQQDQPDADLYAAELADACLPARQEQHHADQDQQRRQPVQVKGQHAGHQRGADVGAEHDGQRRAEGHQPFGDKRGGQQGGGVAALHQRGDHDAGTERQRQVAGAAVEGFAQLRAVHAQDAGAHDMRAPHQEGHGGQQVEQGQHDQASQKKPDRQLHRTTGRMTDSFGGNG
ncbi:hypothetical protein SF06_28530 [Pseudomonas flexibilis]|nr:hypothetical protein SF06_28530 [Pseudomonas flexibilis]